ncbi:MAG: hypothetical protein ACOCZ8_05335, partial [Bacteroidota bacterium]
MKPVQQFLPLAVLCLGLIAVYFAYSPGIFHSLDFDSNANLVGLSYATDWKSIIAFVFAGDAGPLGRPVSLASFVGQREHWPHNPEELLKTNLRLHLLNAALLAVFCFLLIFSFLKSRSLASWVSILSSLLWAVSPLLTTTTLMPIQRMTSLAFLFVIGGLCAHLLIRNLVVHRPLLGYIALSLSVSVFTLLAALSKENGLILPALILVAELFVLKRPEQINGAVWKTWIGIFLVIPFLLILAYLVGRLHYTD